MYPNLKLQLWRSRTRQNRLAQELGVDETFLSKIVNGYREPTSEMRAAIAARLGCEVSWLFEKANAPEPGVIGNRAVSKTRDTSA
jgi:transcriptional regulator with XRE-family HTH domain